jgi:putative endonuclease
MAWVYILGCADNSFYVGNTTDIERRFSEHQTGNGAAYTRKRHPVKLVFAQEFDRIDETFAREKQIQNWGRAKRIALIEGRYGDLNALSRKPPRS